VVCSPLQDISLEELPGTITNPFHPPQPGSDDPHQGVDFSDLSPGTSIALEGRPVQAVLSGRVAGLARERFPYGNALLVETPLEELPQVWLSRLPVPSPAPTLEPRSALTCPQPFTNYDDTGNRSLYLLYAHMQAPAELQLGDPLRCGEVLGAIGGSGNALNPHLHLEARIGPAGARLESLAHYDSSASAEEMSAYCAWRVSGLFQLLDPMAMFSLPLR
jgi:murein DD-endopeptidase MepM/ murein hydrolase activator NlpD